MNEPLVKSEVKNNRIPILFIVPSLCRAGAETQVVNLANLIDSTKFTKYLFTYMQNMEQYSRLNLKEITFLTQPRRNKFDIGVIRSVTKIIDERGIKILHCTMQHSLLIAWLARAFARRKPRIVATIHTTTNESLIGALSDRLLYQRLLRSCDRILFVCQRQRQYWVKKYPFLREKSAVIHNGVDTTYFDPAAFRTKGIKLRKALSISDDSDVICCIAGFRPEKGHDILLEAFSYTDSKCFLLLAGEGQTKATIEDLVRKKQIDTRVRFLGEVPDVRPILAASNVSVLASTAVETFSMAMLESMSMGVPVIASRIGGLSEAIESGKTGYLVPIGNTEAFADSFRQILSDPKSLSIMGAKCRETAIQKFSEKSMVTSTELLLSEIV